MNKSPLDIRVTEYQTSTMDRYSLSQNSLRKTLEKLISPDCVYSIMLTRANTAAQKAIADNSVMLTQARKLDVSEHQTYFDMSLMDSYLSVIDTFAKKEFTHLRYDSIKIDNVHNSDRHPKQIEWPVIHIVNAPEKFKAIVNGLNNDDSFRLLAKREAPQNYNMPAIELLRSIYGTKPLSVDEYLKVEGKTLLLGAELFLRPSYSCTLEHSGLSDD